MNLIFLVLIACFFLFLYVLYYLAKDDFVIVRKDIQMERVFNFAFLTSFVSLFSARFFYVLFNPTPALMNVLGFFAFPYLPGLSLLGALIGGSIFIYVYASFRKLPVGKIFDLFTMSFISTMPFGFLLTFILLLGKTDVFYNILFISSFVVFILFLRIIFVFTSKGDIKDGSLGLMFISLFSLLYFTTKLVLNVKTFSFLNFENVILLVFIFAPLILLINQEILDKFLSKR